MKTHYLILKKQYFFHKILILSLLLSLTLALSLLLFFILFLSFCLISVKISSEVGECMIPPMGINGLQIMWHTLLPQIRLEFSVEFR